MAAITFEERVRAAGVIPVARYVYLVNDASDQARMGGTSSNVYITFQSAYNAANALQLTLGAGVKVAIIVGVTTPVVVGIITLTADYNSDVIIIGKSKTASVVGNIVASSSTGNGFNVTLNAFECTTGTINTSATGTTGNAGSVSLTGDFVAGNITTQANNASNTTGIGGAVILNGLGGNARCGAVNTTARATSGDVTVSQQYTTGTITTSGGTTGAKAGNVTISTQSIATNITAIAGATNGDGPEINITNSTIGALTFSYNSAIGSSVIVKDVKGGNFAMTLGADSELGTFTMYNNSFGSFTLTLNTNTSTDTQYLISNIVCTTFNVTAGAATVANFDIILTNVVATTSMNLTNSSSSTGLIRYSNLDSASLLNTTGLIESLNTVLIISSSSQDTDSYPYARIFVLDATGGSINMTIGVATQNSLAGSGSLLSFKRTDVSGNTVDVTFFGGGEASHNLPVQYSAVTVASDFTSNYIISSYL